MKKLFTLLFFFSLNLQAQEIWKYKGDASFTYKITVDTAINNYDSSTVYFYYFATDINVYNLEEKLIQHIMLDNIDYTFTTLGDDSTYLFIIEDVNFDGYEDFGIQTSLSVRLDRNYQFWLYDTLAGNFKKDTCLSDIMNPEFHPKREVVCSFHHDGSMDHGFSKYRWNHDSLMLFDELSYNEGPVEKSRRGLFKPRGENAYEWVGFITHRWLEEGEWKETYREAGEEIGIGPCFCE